MNHFIIRDHERNVVCVVASQRFSLILERLAERITLPYRGISAAISKEEYETFVAFDVPAFYQYKSGTSHRIREPQTCLTRDKM